MNSLKNEIVTKAPNNMSAYNALFDETVHTQYNQTLKSSFQMQYVALSPFPPPPKWDYNFPHLRALSAFRMSSQKIADRDLFKYVEESGETIFIWQL